MQGSPTLRITAVVPTYQRGEILVDTLRLLLDLKPSAAEILVVDQTPAYTPGTAAALESLERESKIRLIKLEEPSITRAMNVGLLESRNEIVLFLDDDIIPGEKLIEAHLANHDREFNIIAGQVLQPGEEPMPPDQSGSFRFCSDRPRTVTELMGGNFSIKRNLAIRLGGFDENFVRVAYRFEAEFAARAISSGEKIWFAPEASIRHLKASTGGTRAYGDHLRTINPSHSVGEYYYLLRSKGVSHRFLRILKRPIRAVRTKHHLTHPWWIPLTLVAEALGLLWAVAIATRGQRLCVADPDPSHERS